MIVSRHLRCKRSLAAIFDVRKNRSFSASKFSSKQSSNSIQRERLTEINSSYFETRNKLRYGTLHLQSTSLICTNPLQQLWIPKGVQLRWFRTEMDFHTVADETLETIQDTLEEAFEDWYDSIDTTETLPELNYSSGVLTIKFGEHGTWVMNKQTPNRQIWWSSPISGPRRYEYDADGEVWIYTRAGIDGNQETLGQVLEKEIKEMYDIEIPLEI